MNNFKLLEKRTLKKHKPLSMDMEKKLRSEITLIQFMGDTIDLILPKTFQTLSTFIEGPKPLKREKK
ncbi:hypothetical protein [Membranihabitans maritimus]|uniref:hypothetical protein n=1 Tax=Membranihabitans maritimus TaxID=2904244 RepID=UPI001F2F60A0|nr:hypothetical protein [Membranihabitans maritimus]